LNFCVNLKCDAQYSVCKWTAWLEKVKITKGHKMVLIFAE
jgi:hypothetical protein